MSSTKVKGTQVVLMMDGKEIKHLGSLEELSKGLGPKGIGSGHFEMNTRTELQLEMTYYMRRGNNLYMDYEGTRIIGELTNKNMKEFLKGKFKYGTKFPFTYK